MKSITVSWAVVGLFMLMPVLPAWAVTDYSSMSTEELAAKRGTMQQASEEERNAFRQEWQKRYLDMSSEDRQKYGSRPGVRDGSGKGAGQGAQNRNQYNYRNEQRYQNQDSYGRGMNGGMGNGRGGGRR